MYKMYNRPFRLYFKQMSHSIRRAFARETESVLCVRISFSQPPRRSHSEIWVLGCPGPFTLAVSREIKVRLPRALALRLARLDSARLGSTRRGPGEIERKRESARKRETRRGESGTSRTEYRFKPREEIVSPLLLRTIALLSRCARTLLSRGSPPLPALSSNDVERLLAATLFSPENPLSNNGGSNQSVFEDERGEVP